MDIRELDGERLLASAQIEDNVIVALAGIRDPRATVKRILGRVAGTDSTDRGGIMAGFMILAGLRGLEDITEQEANQMPILEGIRDHKVLGREYRRGELRMLLLLVEQRFGPVTPVVRDRLAALSASEMDSTALRLLDARSIEELFG